ncbi:MAG: Ig-like domain-containing protein [Chloroflexi bacterium]|nr:Ig-like domain-containing protein [Chloroflexota bacterium]
MRVLAALALCLAGLPACNLGLPSSPTPPPSPSPAIPRVQILAPPHNQQVIEGVIFDIEILASDAAGIQRIELYVDEQLLQSSESASGAEVNYRVTMNWFAKDVGWHKFSAVAYRPDGRASHPHTIALEVIPPHSPPPQTPPP